MRGDQWRIGRRQHVRQPLIRQVTHVHGDAQLAHAPHHLAAKGCQAARLPGTAGDLVGAVPGEGDHADTVGGHAVERLEAGHGCGVLYGQEGGDLAGGKGFFHVARLSRLCEDVGMGLHLGGEVALAAVVETEGCEAGACQVVGYPDGITLGPAVRRGPHAIACQMEAVVGQVARPICPQLVREARRDIPQRQGVQCIAVQVKDPHVAASSA